MISIRRYIARLPWQWQSTAEKLHYSAQLPHCDCSSLSAFLHYQSFWQGVLRSLLLWQASKDVSACTWRLIRGNSFVLMSRQCKKVCFSTLTASLPMMGAFSTRCVSYSLLCLKYANKSMKAPLLLPLFALIPSSAFSILTSLLYILLDLLSANALIQIADSGQSTSTRLFTSSRKDKKWDSIAIGAA